MAVTAKSGIVAKVTAHIEFLGWYIEAQSQRGCGSFIGATSLRAVTSITYG